MPAAAVIRKGRVLFAWTGRKGRLGGRMKLGSNPECGKPFGGLSIILLEWARVGRISRGKGNFLILGGTPEAKASL